MPYKCFFFLNVKIAVSPTIMSQQVWSSVILSMGISGALIQCWNGWYPSAAQYGSWCYRVNRWLSVSFTSICFKPGYAGVLTDEWKKKESMAHSRPVVSGLESATVTLRWFMNISLGNPILITVILTETNCWWTCSFQLIKAYQF